jgi:probable rRNA maturation factor
VSSPDVAISVEAGDWPPEAALRRLAKQAVGAVVAVIGEAGGGRHASPLPSPPPQGGRELSVVFTDDAGVRRLNARYRGKDKATNVLSFPQKSGPLLGDVILAAETIRREAALSAKPLEDHMAHLIIHGFLHLLGHDHEEDAEAEKMEQLERLALQRLGIPDPYATAISS